ncbi:hypothetical protein [Acetobacter orientalis]|uniref:hypothetical protein n=1 Tax=Acetobacter orientalis TaxID=146474 RepID=UPI0039EB1084
MNIMKNKNIKNFIFIFLLLFVNFSLYRFMSPHTESVAIAACQWDCAWYMGIAKNGYSEHAITEGGEKLGQANWAFFPAYPVLVKIFSYVTHFTYHTSGLILNYALWPLLILLCLKNLALKKLQPKTMWFIVFAMLYPLNIWYFSQYSEPLYGVLLLSSIIFLKENKITLTALTCCAMSLARPTGFVMAIGLALWWFCHNKNRNSMRDSFLLVAAGGLGLSLFVLYLSAKVGDGFAFSHVQIAWGREFKIFPLHIIDNLYVHQHLTATYIALAAIILSCAMVIYGWRLEGFLVALTLVLACSTGVKSIGRLIFANPLTIEFLVYLATSTGKTYRYVLFFLLVCLHVTVIYFWIHGLKILA